MKYYFFMTTNFLNISEVSYPHNLVFRVLEFREFKLSFKYFWKRLRELNLHLNF